MQLLRPLAGNRVLDKDLPSKHTIHMKRTNLVLDEKILEEATRLSGRKTYSATVMLALEDFIRRAKARQILELRGSGLWEGRLGDMRGDKRGKKVS